MKPRTLRETLRDHYEAESLDPDLLERLASLDGRARSGRLPWRRWLVVAATLLFSVGLVLALWNGQREGQLADGIAEEVAMNHSKNLAMEFVAADLAGLRVQMDKLDFALLPSRHLEGRELRLRGARYCSIQGQLAAQIRLVDSAGETKTLYQTPLDTSTDGLSTLRKVTHGIAVEIWPENGLLMVLAETAGE